MTKRNPDMAQIYIGWVAENRGRLLRKLVRTRNGTYDLQFRIGEFVTDQSELRPSCVWSENNWIRLTRVDGHAKQQPAGSIIHAHRGTIFNMLQSGYQVLR